MRVGIVKELTVDARFQVASFAAVSILAVLATLHPNLTAAADESARSQLALHGITDDDLNARRHHGFPSDPDHVLAFVNDGADVGMAEWGFPMTAIEAEAVQRRSAAVQAAYDSGLVDRARLRPDFAGIYVDHEADGQLVVLVTSAVGTAVADLGPFVPNHGAGFRVVTAAVTYAQMEAARDTLMEGPSALRHSLDYEVVSAGIDEASNQLVVTISPPIEVGVTDIGAQLKGMLDVDVRVEVDPKAIVEEICNSRGNCHTPMRAGIDIRKGSATSSYRCTMAFHVRMNANWDKQWVTAGHCGHEGSNNWYHPGHGLVGSETATIYVQGGVDIMRVQITDSQASRQIYGDARLIASSRLPMQSESICASLGRSNVVDCGAVSATGISWIGEACGCTVHGSDHNNIATMGGDSGSPIYVRLTSTTAVAVGVHNTAGGGFANVHDALWVWGATVIPP